MWSHLKNNHSKQYYSLKKEENEKKENESLEESKQSTIQISSEYGTKKKNISFLSGSVNKSNIDLKIAEMIILDLQPISFVEDKGFRNLLRLLCPSYLVPGLFSLIILC